MLIGITGFAGVGKDTAAEALRSQLGFVVKPFAGPLKMAASVLFGNHLGVYSDRFMKESVDSFWGMTHRKQLQLLGTEAIRKTFGDDFWLKRMELEISTMQAKYPRVVIPDVRFDNEADWVRSQGGHIVHVTAPWETTLSSEATQHASESGVMMSAEDFAIYNGGSIADLQKTVVDMIRSVMSDTDNE